MSAVRSRQRPPEFFAAAQQGGPPTRFAFFACPSDFTTDRHAMFDSVRNNKKLVQIFLLLITSPFALWGVDSYMSGGGAAGDLATAGKNKLTQQQFQDALREQGERMRAATGGQFDAATMERPEVRQAVLDNLINQRLLLVHAMESRVGVSNEQLAQAIASIPELQVG